MLNEESPSVYRENDCLLDELERILDSDRLIDELGFVHPSQIEALNNDKELLSINGVHSIAYNDTFWHKDHMLAISTSAIHSLFKSAKSAYTRASDEYKKDTLGSNSDLERLLESKVMKHSKAFLLLNYDNSSVWNVRKLVMSRNPCLSTFMDELQLSALILSYAAKSEQTWSQRRWVIKMIISEFQTIPEVIARESELVENIAEVFYLLISSPDLVECSSYLQKFKMNYRAWHHRCWLVSYMTKIQVGVELSRSRKWAEMHIADNCGFHFRRRLIMKMSDDYLKSDSELGCQCSDERFRLLEEELTWNETLIKQFVGRETLWVHRRFIFQRLVGNIQTDNCVYCCHTKNVSSNQKLRNLLDAELQLLQFCLQYSYNDFEDDESQKEFAASYVVWITKQIHCSESMEFRKKVLELGELGGIISMFCPGKLLVWETLAG